MDVTTFLARSLGSYLLIVSVGMLWKREQFIGVALKFLENEALVFFAGIVTLILGILMVVAHNIWTDSWSVIITLLAWITLLEGILYLFFPKIILSAKRLYENALVAYLISLVVLCVGLYLLYRGYYS